MKDKSLQRIYLVITLFEFNFLKNNLKFLFFVVYEFVGSKKKGYQEIMAYTRLNLRKSYLPLRLRGRFFDELALNRTSLGS